MRKPANILSLYCCLAALIFLSCRPNRTELLPTGNLDINIQVVYAGEPVVFGEQGFEYQNQLIRFDDFKFYISNVELLSENKHDGTDLLDIQLADFSDVRDNTAAQFGKSFFATSIPAGSYSGIRLDLGVPPDLNTTSFKKDKYFGSHPLNREEMYSQTYDSYYFMKLKGEADTDKDGDFDDLLFRYETATNSLFKKNILLSKAISISPQVNARIHLIIDLKTLLNGGEEAVSITAQPETNSQNMNVLGRLLMQNLGEAISIE